MKDPDRIPALIDQEPPVCILTEADILAGRDEDCTTHDHEDAA